MAFLNNLNLENDLVSKSLAARNPFEMVYDISGGYNTFTYFTNMLNNKGSKQVDSEKYEKAKLGNLDIATQVASNVVVGTNLQVNFVDPNFSLFRINDMVADSEKIKGKVVAKSAGQITIAPIDVAVWNAAIHFTANMYAKVFYDASPNRFSTGKSSIYNTPELDFNFSSLTRNSVTIASQDFISTYVMVKGDYWVHNQQLEMLKSFAKQVEKKFIFSDRGQTVDAAGVTNHNGGMIWAIKNRGGTYFPANAALTETTFQDLIQTVKTKSPIATNKLTFLGGADAISALQKFTAKYIQFGGSYNTFGVGANGGLNVMNYKFLGIEVDIIHLPIFDDPILFPEISAITGKPRQSASFFLMDTTPVPIVGGGTQPTIERFHFGSQEMTYAFVPGMINLMGGNPSNVMSGSYHMTSSDIDGVACHVQSRNGIDVIDAKAMVYFELTS